MYYFFHYLNKHVKKCTAFILTLAMVLSMALPVFAAGGNELNDQVNSLTIQVNGITVTEGIPISLKNNDEVTFIIEWKIDGTQLAGAQEGDFIKILLPQKDIFTFHETGLDEPLSDDTGIIAYWGIDENGDIYCELTDYGAQQISLQGTFTVSGKVNFATEPGNSIIIDLGDDIKVEIELDPDQPTPGDGDYPGGGGLIDPPAIDKYGHQLSAGSKKISWYVNINQDVYYDIATGKDLTQNNVVIEDVLPAGLRVDNITLQTLIQRPIDATGEPSITGVSKPLVLFSRGTVGENNGANCLNTSPVYLTSDDLTESYTDFRQRVIDTAGISYGVFHDTAADQFTVVVSLGNLPGNGITYNDVLENNYHKGTFQDNLAFHAPELTAAELTALEDAFADGGSLNQIGGQIITYRLYINTTGILGETYDNNATLMMNGDPYETDDYSVETKYLNGEVTVGEPFSVRIYKKEQGTTDKMIKGAAFKLQIWDNGWEEYTPMDGGLSVRETDVSGLVEFEKLYPGKYRVVEVSAALGYDLKSVTYDPSDEFTITAGDSEGITIIAYNSRTSRNTGGFTMTKRSTKDNALLSKAGFILYRLDADNEKEYYTVDSDDNIIWVSNEADALKLFTGSDGTIAVDGLPLPGVYYLQETDAPAGHVLPAGEDAIEIFELDKDNDTIILTIENKPTEPGEPGDPEEPEGPEEPGKPGEPGNPDGGREGTIDPKDPKEPKTPEEPREPSEPETPSVTDPYEPAMPEAPEEEIEDKIPETLAPATGDSSNGILYAGLCILSLGGLLIIRRRYS